MEDTLQVAVRLHQDHHLHHLVVQTLLIVHHQEVHRQALPLQDHLQAAAVAVAVADHLRVAAVAEAQVVDVDNQT